MGEITRLTIEYLTSTPALVILALVVLVALTFMGYRRTNPPIPGGMKSLMVALRAIAILALSFTLMEPVLSFDLVGDRKPRLNLLVDVSGSMQIKSGERSRIAVVDSALGSGAFTNVLSQYDVRRSYFSGSAYDSRSDAENQRDSLSSTALGDAISLVTRQQSAEPADAWLVLSDGINNAGIDPLEASRSVTAPIVTVGVGDPAAGFDIEMQDVQFNPVAYVGAETPIRARIRWRGAEKVTDAVVELLEEGTRQPVSTERVKLGTGELSVEVELEYTPTSPGGKFLRVRVSSSQPESNTENNQRVFSLQALKSKVKTLLVTESLNWDYKFIKNALTNNDRIELSEAIETAPGVYQEDQFPVNDERLGEFDIIILCNPSGNRTDNRYDRLVTALQSGGAGVFLFLGERYLQSAGRSGARSLDHLSPLVPISNVRFRQMLDRTTPFSVRGENSLHPTIRITDRVSELRQAWSDFPPLQRIVPVQKRSSDVVTLLESAYEVPISDSGAPEPIPLLAYEQHGQGKIVAFNGSPLWRLAFQSINTEKTQTRFNEFIERVVNWLSISEEISPIRLKPERDVYARGEKIEFFGTALDEGYRPLDAAGGELYLFHKETNDTLGATIQSDENGQLSAEISGATPGSYRYIARITVGDKVVKTDTGSVLVAPYSLEERETTPQFDRLVSIAQVTGGSYMHITQSEQLSAALPGTVINVDDSVQIPLRGRWPFLAVFIAALSAEWFLRKRRQLL